MWLKVGNKRLPGEGDGETGGHGSSYNTIPRAVFVLSAALLVMRSAQTFYVPIFPLYIRILDTSIPLFVVELVAGVHGHFRAEGIGAAGCFRWTYGRGALIGALGYRNALIGYGAIATLWSLIFLFGVTEPSQNRAERRGK
jgi:hypothetical protein